jgi:ADP-heptose:LPS heptosyltransferase
MRALVLTNGGLGNGMIIDPVLRAAGTRRFEFHHTDNLWLAECSQQMPGLRGFVPSVWRRFQNKDDIVAFLRELKIDTVLNARKEDPARDTAYFEFKCELLRLGSRVFDLHDSRVPLDEPIGHQIAAMFRLALPDLPPVDWSPLRHGAGRSGVTFYVGASMPKKCPNPALVRAVAAKIVSELAFSPIRIAAGVLPFESALLTQYQDDPASNLSIIKLNNLREALELVRQAKLVVTSDSCMSHLASLAGCEVITVFTCTNGSIWRNSTQGLANIVQSEIPLQCVQMKIDGTCSSFYEQCSCRPGEDLCPNELFLKIARLLQPEPQSAKRVMAQTGRSA